MVTLFDYDKYSANDFLGDIKIDNQGKDYQKRELLTTADSKYYVTYEVQHDVQDAVREIMKWMMCGTTKCKYCEYNPERSNCHGTSIVALYTDKDKSVVRECPLGYSHAKWKKVEQSWPYNDTYLRICRPA